MDLVGEDRLDVDDRRAIHGFQVLHGHPATVDSADLDLMQPERIGAMRRASAEYARWRSVGVAPGMHAQHIPPCAIEPGDQQDLVAWPDAKKTLDHIFIEHKPRGRRAFVGLSRGRLEIGERRGDLSDGPNFEAAHDNLPASTQLVTSAWSGTGARQACRILILPR